MKSPRLASLLAIITTGLLINADAATSTWADPQLPVKQGLTLWLDASVQNAARQARQLPTLADNAELDVWFDGSGRESHLNQAIVEARPRLRRQGGVAAVLFDGKDDFLAASNLRVALTNATLFIHAAPVSNVGGFRGLLGMNQFGGNDYTTGLNVDLGPGGSGALSFLNVEGAGCVGAVNLLKGQKPFGAFHTLAVLTQEGPGGTRVFEDGDAGGVRDRASGVVRMDELTVGARRYSNNPNVAPFAQGFFHGEIAEVLLYDRVLPERERAEVQKYLATKYASLKAGAVDPTRQSLVTVSNPPPVQMLVPGFTVRELPVSLNNVNNVKYRADGKLVALGYDGRIYLLSGGKENGLEDKVEPFWDRESLRAPIGMALTPPGYARGDGVFVAAKGKLALILDRDRDGRADEEVTVAEGWPVLMHNVDALGVALDREGNIYFGLGCANFTDAYLIDKTTGRARYDLASERGTILKVSPDFSRREIVCTGIRFPVAMAFNAAGDLFCTDQEGATWLANGNPFDELLHIQPGRHYGFPPRHPKHLPNVIDEPSVFDYTPQHQSTCGFSFNEPVNRGPIFGPAWWRSDAIVTGESRGKLYRTKLVKTPAGYVAQNQLIGCLNMLTIDACVSPEGALVVACHSGAPDWGSGPNGKGKLFKIVYSDTSAPQPVLAYATSPGEMRIAFDRPLDPGQLKNLTGQTEIARGKYAAAGDRFESFRPGYQVVQDQQATARSKVPVLSASMTPDRRVLVIKTPPQREAMNYAITLPGLGRPSTTGPADLPQHPQIDLAANLTGVETSWRSQDGTNEWTGWLPHLDLRVARSFTTNGADHERLWPLLGSAGTLRLRTQLDLWQMLRPAVQPGAKIDYTLPTENVTLVMSASRPFSVKTASTTLSSSAADAGRHQLFLSHAPKEGEWLPVEISLPTASAAEAAFELTWHTAEDPRPRAMPLRRMLVPWASPQAAPPEESERQIPALAGGNWLRGQAIFFGDAVACHKCHQIDGRGGKIGPDLSNLLFRDYESVLKDIMFPSAALNPDHLAYNLEFKDGEGMTGIIQRESAQEILVADVSGKSTAIPRAKIASMKLSTVSLMPEGLDRALNEQGMKDLMTFLLTRPLQPAALECAGEPPPRSRSEFEALLKNTALPAKESRPLRIVLCTGPKDHGPGEHDYPLWQKRWSRLLSLSGNVSVTTAEVWPTASDMQSADAIIFYSDNPGWNSARSKELDAFLARGGGAVFLHYAVDGHQDVDELAKRIGLAWRGGASKFRHGPLDLKFQPHPLSVGLSNLNVIDESYWNLVGNEKDITVLASGVEEGASKPLLWTRQQGKGRIFVSIPGHYTWTFDDPFFRLLILRGLAWSVGEPIDRFAELAPIGARISEN